MSTTDPDYFRVRPKVIMVRVTLPNGHQEYRRMFECWEEGCPAAAVRPDDRCAQHTTIHDKEDA